MGIEQSILNPITNPCWIRYQIQRIESSPHSIKFFLDNSVKYSNGYSSYVYCTNSYPYYDIHAGDRIEANWYKTEDYNSSHEFNSEDNLRIIRFQQRLLEYASVVPNYNNRFRINGNFVIERRFEKQGDVEIEYIEDVRIRNGEVVANYETKIETRYRAI